MKCPAIKILEFGNLGMESFTTPNSKNIYATLRIVTIEKSELTFLLILYFHEITGQPVALSKRLSILGNRDNLPKLVAFLKSIIKYFNFSSFSLVTYSCKILSLKLTSL